MLCLEYNIVLLKIHYAGVQILTYKKGHIHVYCVVVVPFCVSAEVLCTKTYTFHNNIQNIYHESRVKLAACLLLHSRPGRLHTHRSHPLKQRRKVKSFKFKGTECFVTGDSENAAILLPFLNLWIGIRFSCSLDKRFFLSLFLYCTHLIIWTMQRRRELDTQHAWIGLIFVFM